MRTNKLESKPLEEKKGTSKIVHVDLGKAQMNNDLDNIVVNFEDPCSRRDQKIEAKSEKRKFMSSKLSKLLTEERSSHKSSISSNHKQDDEEDKKERMNILKDKELKELIETHDLIREYNESELFGVERRKLFQKKALKIGAVKKPHHPREVRLGLHKAAIERINKQVEDARHSNLYNRKLSKNPRVVLGLDKHDTELLDSKFQNKRKKKKTGLSTGIGRYKDGVLFIDKKTLNFSANS